jgi:hypothetical protein
VGHAFASILMDIGKDPTRGMAQLGHTDPRLALRVYAHPLVGDEAGRRRLRAVVGAGRSDLAHRWTVSPAMRRGWFD